MPETKKVVSQPKDAIPKLTAVPEGNIDARLKETAEPVSAVVAVPSEPSEERMAETTESAVVPVNAAPNEPQLVVAQTGDSVTLPSGASFSLNPGQTYTVSPDDAKALIDSGAAVAAN